MTIFMNTSRTYSTSAAVVYPETTTYYVVRLNFKHDVGYKILKHIYKGRAGQSKFLWSFHEVYKYWRLCENRPSAYRFRSIRAARDAARQISREEYGGDRCCERVIERVTETVDRYAGVRVPPTVDDDGVDGDEPRACTECAKDKT